jgi:predicted transcriptional regulator
MSDYEDGFITRLSVFGLNEKGARVYFCLLNNGGKTVPELQSIPKATVSIPTGSLSHSPTKGLLKHR